jgi:hypothetical protein
LSRAAASVPILQVDEERWECDRLVFRVRALGQAASGHLDVAEDHARLLVALRWLLQRFAKAAQVAIRNRGHLLLTERLRASNASKSASLIEQPQDQEQEQFRNECWSNDLAFKLQGCGDYSHSRSAAFMAPPSSERGRSACARSGHGSCRPPGSAYRSWLTADSVRKIDNDRSKADFVREPDRLFCKMEPVRKLMSSPQIGHRR